MIKQTKSNKVMECLSDTISELVLIDIYRILYQKAPELTFFLSTLGLFNKIYQVMGHKTNFNKFRWIQIIVFYSLNSIKVEIYNTYLDSLKVKYHPSE